MVVDLLILPPSAEALYGKAEFRNGASEPDEGTPTTPAAVPTSTPKADAIPEFDNSGEGWNLLRKGFFLVVILGCIVVYLRVNKKKDKRSHEKSLV
jgi:hypothetical protein